ncbi:MAG: metallophosphoesterase [Proteobacteria bacterium]|nr:metallophosphoesterase [Pseudomonadota bacterium]
MALPFNKYLFVVAVATSMGFACKARPGQESKQLSEGVSDTGKSALPAGEYRIAIVSDIHAYPSNLTDVLADKSKPLLFDEPSRPADPKITDEIQGLRRLNNQTFKNLLRHLLSDQKLTDVILNGDFIDGRAYPSGITKPQRIILEVAAVRQLAKSLNSASKKVKLHFNIGNHEEFWDFTTEKSGVLDQNFTKSLITELNSDPLNDQLIVVAAQSGGSPNSRGTVDYRVRDAGPSIWISHSPNATSSVICAQSAKSLLSDKRAFLKMATFSESTPDPVNMKLTSQWHVASDTHLAALDAKRRILNTGALSAIARPLKDAPPTFAVLTSNGVKLFQLKMNGDVLPYDPAIQKFTEQEAIDGFRKELKNYPLCAEP